MSTIKLLKGGRIGIVFDAKDCHEQLVEGGLTMAPILSHSEARELAMAILSLTDQQNAVKAKETGNAGILRGIPQWVHNAAHDCHMYAMERVGHMRGKCIVRQAAFADAIAAHLPKTNSDWIEAAVDEVMRRWPFSSTPRWMLVRNLTDTIRKHAPKS